MAHIKIKYVEPMCTLYNPYEATWDCFNDEGEPGCQYGEYGPSEYIGKDGTMVLDIPKCKYASRKEIEKEGNFKSWTLEKDDKNVISLLLGKTYIQGDNISYLEIDGRVLVEEIMKLDDD